MNIVITGIIIFVITFLLLSWFARQKTHKIAKDVRTLIVILSLLIAIILAIGGRILFSLPLFFTFQDPKQKILHTKLEIRNSFNQLILTLKNIKKYTFLCLTPIY